MPTMRKRLSAASRTRSGASSRQGTHQDAQTLSTVTCPRKSALASPGTGFPSCSMPATGGRLVSGAGWSISAEGMREISPAPRRMRNSAARPRKSASGSSTKSRRRPTLAVLSLTDTASILSFAAPLRAAADAALLQIGQDAPLPPIVGQHPDDHGGNDRHGSRIGAHDEGRMRSKIHDETYSVPVQQQASSAGRRA